MSHRNETEVTFFHIPTRARGVPDTEKLVGVLETLRDFDMGLGAPISFDSTEHQGSHKVWGTQLDEYGRYQAIDLE
jgi:hypothetical protein